MMTEVIDEFRWVIVIVILYRNRSRRVRLEPTVKEEFFE